MSTRVAWCRVSAPLALDTMAAIINANVNSVPAHAVGTESGGENVIKRAEWVCESRADGKHESSPTIESTLEVERYAYANAG